MEQRYEAREWLRSSDNESALASNRFGYTSEALRFVEQLYMLGAAVVYVTNVSAEDWRIEEEGGPYADALVIGLPTDPDRRAALIEIASQESQDEGFEPIEDDGQDEVFLWWD